RRSRPARDAGCRRRRRRPPPRVTAAPLRRLRERQLRRTRGMAETREDRIARRAYEIWEEEGRPHGRDQEHWRRAAEEIADEERQVVERGRERSETIAPAKHAEAGPPPIAAGRATVETPVASSARASGEAIGERGPDRKRTAKMAAEVGDTPKRRAKA